MMVDVHGLGGDYSTFFLVHWYQKRCDEITVIWKYMGYVLKLVKHFPLDFQFVNTHMSLASQPHVE